MHLKNKRQTIAMHLRNDLANLILNGHQDIALQRVCIYMFKFLLCITNMYIHTIPSVYLSDRSIPSV
jgi:hypothetical protein